MQLDIVAIASWQLSAPIIRRIIADAKIALIKSKISSVAFAKRPQNPAGRGGNPGIGVAGQLCGCID